MPKQPSLPPPAEPKVFKSTDEIDFSISKLQRRIGELENMDIRVDVLNDTGNITVVASNIRETIREVFGSNSPEFREHEHLDLWAGGLSLGMSYEEIVEHRERGRRMVIGILSGLIGRLREKKDDLDHPISIAPTTYFDRLNLHPRIAEVSRELFLDGHWWEGVFAASKALVNYVKERSGRHDLDGTNLVRTVFSKNNPVLLFNDLSDQTDLDEQEGMMHLFEGAILAIRNPGGHSFPEGSEQRAIEYISLVSLLAYRTQEAKRRGRFK